MSTGNTTTVKLGDIVVINSSKVGPNSQLEGVRMTIDNIDERGSLTGVWQDENGICFWAYVPEDYVTIECD